LQVVLQPKLQWEKSTPSADTSVRISNSVLAAAARL